MYDPGVSDDHPPDNLGKIGGNIVDNISFNGHITPMTDTDQENPEDIETRMTAALKRALATPPTPHKPKDAHAPKPNNRGPRSR